MKEKLFECIKCGEFDNAGAWMESTKEDVIKYGKSGDNIPMLTEDMVNSGDCYYYICPHCGETCYVEDNQIKVFKAE